MGSDGVRGVRAVSVSETDKAQSVRPSPNVSEGTTDMEDSGQHPTAGTW